MELLVPGKHDGQLEKGSGLSRLRAGGTVDMEALVSRVPALGFWHVIITGWEDQGGMGN